MWNYSFMFPSMLVLATLLCFYFSRPRLPIRLNRTYLSMLIVEFMIMVSDFVSTKADENYRMFTPGMLYFLNTAFFVFFFARIFLFFRFAVRVLALEDHRRALRALYLPFVGFEAVACSSFLTGAIFSIRDGAYQSGPLYGLLNYGYLFYIIAMLMLFIVYRSRLKPLEQSAGLGYTIMLLAGVIMRMLFPRLLVMNTFSLAALLIIFLEFENPDLYLSDRGRLFNMRGFQALLSELSARKNYHILSFGLKNYSRERGILGGAQMDQGIELISQYLLRTFPECLSFYLRGGRFVLIGPSHLSWETFRDQIDERFKASWKSGNSTLYLSVGFVDIRPQARLDSADRIINNLTIALEAVARPDAEGQHSQVLDSENLQHLDEQVDILRSLDRSIQNDAVEVFLQPVYASDTRRMVAAEALARIRDENGQIIPPGLFIPIAEQNGYIDQLGEIVFEKTCAFIHAHGMSALNLEWVNVNLSPIQCMQRNLSQRFNAILKRYDVPADRLHLEITEQSMIDYSLLEAQIVALRESGFQFVLDDYGSGYSNLTRVKHYPFINIKLDMEIVWDFFRNRDSLLPNIVEGFRGMGFSITAEGIETEDMADALAGIGCDYLQGFLFDRPLPFDEFVRKYGKQARA